MRLYYFLFIYYTHKKRKKNHEREFYINSVQIHSTNIKVKASFSLEEESLKKSIFIFYNNTISFLYFFHIHDESKM